MLPHFTYLSISHLAGKGLTVINENGKQRSDDEATAESMEESSEDEVSTFFKLNCCGSIKRSVYTSRKNNGQG